MSLLAAAPALPLHTAGKYVAAAYIVFFALILIYVAIMAARLSRIERDLGELLERFDAPRARRAEDDEEPDLESAIELPEESARV
jgi:hypothetical protein